MKRAQSGWWMVILVLFIPQALYGAGVTPRPASFYGTVTAGGSNVPAGTIVSAWIEGVKYSEAPVFPYGDLAVYRLDIPADLPETSPVEGGHPGKTVVFKLGGGEASQSIWQEGGVRLDLSASLGPDLALTVDDGRTAASPGNTLTYTITVVNHGPGPASGVTVRDTLPSASSFVVASDGGTYAAGVITWPAFDLAEGQSAVRTVTVEVDSAVPADLETITNTVTVADDGTRGLDPHPGNNSAADVDALDALADLSVDVFIEGGFVEVFPGQRLVYFVDVSNRGSRDARGVTYRSTLPEGVTLLVASDGGSETGGIITWPSLDLAAGSGSSRIVTVIVNRPLPQAVASLEVTVEAQHSGADANPSDDSASLVIPVLQRPDLTVASVDTAGATTDPQSLVTSGTVAVEIANEGNLDATDPFALVVFEDRNGDGLFSAAADYQLGQTQVADAASGAASISVDVPVSGTVLFRDNRIFAFVDSGLAIEESDEANNVGHTGQTCGSVPTPESFSPVVELSWPGPDVIEPRSKESLSTPLVVNLTDDNGDGRIDAGDVPDLVFVTSELQDITGTVPVMLRAIRGDTGAAIWNIPGFFLGGERVTFALSGQAAGDLDGDGLPEIVTSTVDLLPPYTGEPVNRLIAYEHDGTRKWVSGFYACRPNGGPTTRDNPYIADLDGDEQPEIIVGALVFDGNGNLLWQGSGGQAYQSNSNQETHLSGCTSIVADLDLFGPPELVTGNTAYYSDGSIYWQVDQDDGYPAVGNFDDDPYPEIVVVAKGRVRLMEHDGTVIWGPHELPGTKPVAGGAPTIADFDGDGEPEIGVASSDFYVVYETDGSVKWQRSTQDRTSNMTGSTVFDLDGDGRFEVIYRDERKLRIYRGEDGTVLFEQAVSSNTHNEEPVVADVDGDGNAEIVVTSDLAPAVGNIPSNERTFGLRVFGDANDQWVGTRGIWNQHAYSGVNVRDDGTIPEEPEWSWLTHNTYRAQVAPDRQTFAAPDLSVSRVIADLTAYPSIRITVRVGNGGDAPVKTGLPVAFYDADPASGGHLLGTASVSKTLKPGEYEDLVFSFAAPDFSTQTVVIAADDDGTGRGRERECDEANNRTAVSYDAAFLGLTLALTDGQATVLEGETVTYTLSVFNASHHVATGVELTDLVPAHTALVAADGGGMLSDGIVRWPVFELAPGATAHRTLTVRIDDPVPTTVTEIVNQASVTDDGSQGPDPTPANNSAEDRNRIATLRADAGGPYEADEGVAVTFDASGSRIRVGTIISYEWDLDGDGDFDDALGVRVARAFPDERSVTVSSRVTDSLNQKATDTASLTVRNAAPVVEAGPNRKIARGGALALIATAFTDSGSLDTHTATVDWGDGGAVQMGAVTENNGTGTVAASHSYLSNGVYTVTVCVADQDGGTGCDSFAVEVGNGWVLLGHANDVVRPGCIRFTDGTWNHTGAAWYTEKLDLAESFDKTFRVYLGNSQLGVDGLTFTLHNAATGTSTLGDVGGFLGYRGILPSLAVEMDIFGNSGNSGHSWSFIDPPENHLAVNENGTLDHRGHPAVKLPNIEDGTEHLLRVIWNAPMRTLDVHFDGTERLMYSKDLVEQIFDGATQVYWGLTGASGHGSAEQYFCETAACEPGATPLVSVGDVRVTEEESAPVVASFPVTLSCAAEHEVRVDVSTTDGTALAGLDYEAASTTLVFQPGETSRAVDVQVTRDRIGEPTEQFFVDLSRPQGGAIRYTRGVGTIRDLRPPTIHLTGTIRDFKVEHPDFEVRPSADPGIVLPTLGPDRKPVYAGLSGNPTTSGAENFDQWYRDVPGVNMAQELSIALQPREDDPRVFRYSNRQFFVIDGELFGNEGYSHNNHFTYELHAQFLYEGGETLRFFSDDDMWVFINGRLALDMGGCTCQQMAIQVDARAAELGLIPGGFYDMDIFYAERHSGGATFEMETTLAFPNENPGVLQLSSPSYEAGEAGTSATITVTREGGSEGQVAVSYATADGTATALADYGAVSGTITFANGDDTSKTFSIPIVDDNQVEGDETVQISLANPTGGAALGTAAAVLNILDDDEVDVGISIEDVRLAEGDAGTTDAVFVVRLTSAGSREIHVDYATVAETATEGTDYLAAHGMLTFAPGEIRKEVRVPVVGDVRLEPDETFRVELANAVGAGLDDGTAMATIEDDDMCPGPNLLINPGAEAPRGRRGSIPGWREEDCSPWEIRRSNPPPAEGEAYFNAGRDERAELVQDVKVSAYAAWIDQGGQAFAFEGWVRTKDESPSDTARIVVEYRDASNAVVLDAFDTGEVASPLEWQRVADARFAPEGTRWIRVRLISDRYANRTGGSHGSSNDGYFDALALRSLRIPALVISDASVTEGSSGWRDLLFGVTLSCPVDTEISVSHATADGTAQAGSDYQAVSGSLAFPAGATERAIAVPVLGDRVREPQETLELNLSAPQPPGAAVLVDPQGIGTILDDDACPRSPGYWKTHVPAWPVDSLVIGGSTYERLELLGFLHYGGSDASLHLARQLVATKLNLAAGSEPSILPSVDAADAFLADHPPGSRPRGALREQANALKDQLDAYNNSPCQEEMDEDRD